MQVRKAKSEDLKELVEIYRNTFKVHNIFTKSDEEVLRYLEGNIDNIFVVEDGKVLGGLFLVKLEYEYRLRHFAVAEKHHGLGTELLNFVEKQIEKPAKLSVHVSENEKDSLEFFQHRGFSIVKEVEGRYRLGEKVYFLENLLE